MRGGAQVYPEYAAGRSLAIAPAVALGLDLGGVSGQLNPSARQESADAEFSLILLDSDVAELLAAGEALDENGVARVSGL